MLAGGLLFGAPAAAEDAKPDPATQLWERGRLDLRYVFRSTGESSASDRTTDHDLMEDLFVEAGRGDSLRFEASGRVHEDLGGRQRALSPFRDIYDTYGEPVHAYMYTAYGEALDVGPLASVRIGRQYYDHDVEVRFDGALVETRPFGDALAVTAYGGLPVHLYEASRRADWLAGGAAELLAIPRTVVRLDYAHDQDFRPDLERAEAIDGIPRTVTRRDDYYQLAITHRLAEDWRLRAEASTFGGRSSRFTGEALFQDRDWDLTSRLRYTFQLGAYRDLSIDFSPLDDVLGAYEPYHEAYFDLRKGIATHFTMGGGASIRRLAHEGDAGPFNHEFERVFGLLDATDWPWEGLTVSPMCEAYWSESGHETFQASGDISQRIGAWTVGGGTSYAYYKFDEFFLAERERVRTYFGDVAWQPFEWLRPRIEYSYEEDQEGDRFHVVRADLRITF
jgi:hypothetical protein